MKVQSRWNERSTETRRERKTTIESEGFPHWTLRDAVCVVDIFKDLEWSVE